MYFDPLTWTGLPFHFWSVVFFVFGAVVGSFLNVCIYRMPRGMSIISPPSHCPDCNYSIPWYLNIPLVTWLALRGKCAHCKGPISARYFLVELLTALAFMASWIGVGRISPALALAYCLVFAGFIVASFIDFEHFIIPDEITIGGMAAGFLCSLAVPALHDAPNIPSALKHSVAGMIVGGGLVYVILRIGKVLFGRHKVVLQPDSRVVFTETALVLPEKAIPYEELFYRKSDVITFEAKMVELIDRCYKGTRIRLTPQRLEIGDEVYDPQQVPHIEAITDHMILPREAMGLGDVKFMAAIGAFLGWKATLFSLMLSSIIGAAVGLTLIVLRRQEWSSRLPYGPYIAVAAVIWMFGGKQWLAALFQPRLLY